MRRLGLSSGRVRDGLTKIDLAEMLGRSRKTIRHWIHQGWLKGCYERKQGCHDIIRVSEGDLLEFWQNHPEEILFHRWRRDGIEWFLGLLSEREVAKTSEGRVSQAAIAIYLTDDQNFCLNRWNKRDCRDCN
jgi:transposase